MHVRFDPGPITLLSAFLAFGTLACAGADPADPHAGPRSPSEIILTIDRSKPLGIVDGFGATTRSLVYGSEDYLGAVRQRAIEAVFDSVGLSLGFMPPGLLEAPRHLSDPWSQRGNDNGDPRRMEPNGFNFLASDQMVQKILQPARGVGFAGLTLGPLLDLRSRQAWLRDIRAADYDLYLEEAAENVEAVVRHWTEAYGERPERVYLFNEPTSGNMELGTTSIQEVVDLVRVVGERLEGAGFGDIGFIVPNEETMARSKLVAEAILADSRARRHVAAIGYHPYPYGSAYSSPKRILDESGRGNPNAQATMEMQALRELGERYGVPVWMTEVSEGPGRADFPPGSIENVLARAIHIHDTFRYAGASAFFGMMALWDSRSHDEHFPGGNVPFLTEQSTAVLVDTDSEEVTITAMGRAIGHYARWIGPGARRLDVAAPEEPGLLVTAFETDDDGGLVLVVVNAGDAPRRLRFQLAGGTRAGSVRGEISHSGAMWAPLTPFPADPEGAVLYEAPGRSVTTLATRPP